MPRLPQSSSGRSHESMWATKECTSTSTEPQLLRILTSPVSCRTVVQQRVCTKHDHDNEGISASTVPHIQCNYHGRAILAPSESIRPRIEPLRRLLRSPTLHHRQMATSQQALSRSDAAHSRYRLHPDIARQRIRRTSMATTKTERA